MLMCKICDLPLRIHPMGHCPFLHGERLVVDPVTARTLRRRELRKAERVSK